MNLFKQIHDKMRPKNIWQGMAIDLTPLAAFMFGFMNLLFDGSLWLLIIGSVLLTLRLIIASYDEDQ